ncbi:hypothetical protein QMP97_00970 [Xanthomonas oryzae pv. oryzae]|uniref:hypothetical protein n=1 Tax=Xanthomonas oryzae TaxID=347 RepID=UPI0024AFF629|nr:hypothetical protein [Xanthomonas oryzae]MDI9069009.1 hypothetical protein [Xanthomonas oryzae pv. oryzae]
MPMLRGETGTGCSGVGTLMLFACVGIVVLCASGMVMWCGGASRPGRIGAPGAGHHTPHRWLLALALAAATAIALPLVFFSLLVVWTFDRWIRPRSPLFRWLD